MYGRYGGDQLYFALIIIFFVISVVNTFIGSYLLWILQYVLLIWAVYRYFSRNIYKRRQENRKFLGIWQSIKNFFAYLGDKFRDRKVCRYRKCKHCHAALRLPIKKGKNSVKCPRCGKSFKVNIWI
ncbi:MAG: hypothetical protein IJ002_07655 [Clostridia bacterium]|nr:hypothetical protein [Clostridia bacterium]